MQVVQVSKYNSAQEQKYNQDLERDIKLHPFGSDRPPLRHYVYFKSYGYVAYGDDWSIWGKTKKDAQRKAENRNRQTLLTDKIKNQVAAHPGI